MNLSQMKDAKAELIRKAQTMLDAGQHTTPAYRVLITEAETLTEDITMLESIERRTGGKPLPVPAPVVAVPTVVRTTTEHEGQQRKDKRAALNASLRHALRNGRRNGEPEQRDLDTITDGSGAALFGQTAEDQAEWTRALANFAPLVDKIATNYAPTGANRKFTVSDQTSQFMLTIPETTATDAAESSPTLFSNVTGTLAPIVGRTTVSFQISEDVDDLVGYLKAGFMVQAGRAEELAILTGKDHAGNVLVSTPTGALLTAAPVGATVTTANQISPVDIANLGSSVDYAYFMEGDYVASQAVYGFLASQLATTNRYLYPRDEQGNLIINGKKLIVASNAAMASMTAAAGTPLMLFGSFKRAWGATITPFRLQILEPTPETMTTQVVGHFRIGQVGLVANAVKSLVQAS
jgi:HK97 family phage major capsid protein